LDVGSLAVRLKLLPLLFLFGLSFAFKLIAVYAYLVFIQVSLLHPLLANEALP